MNGTALSEMPFDEQRLTDDDPDLLEAVELTEEIRGKELLRAYKLREKLKRTPLEDHAAIIERWAQATGRSAGAWKGDLKWAYAIHPDDLLGVFQEEGISQGEWTARIGTSHLGAIARAKHQDNHQLLTSRERAEWARRAFHCNWSVDELTGALRDNDLLAAKRGSGLAAPSKMPTTLADLLRLMADAAEADENPPLPCELKPGTYSVRGTMHSIANLLPKTTFTLGTREEQSS